MFFLCLFSIEKKKTHTTFLWTMIDVHFMIQGLGLNMTHNYNNYISYLKIYQQPNIMILA